MTAVTKGHKLDVFKPFSHGSGGQKSDITFLGLCPWNCVSSREGATFDPVQLAWDLPLLHLWPHHLHRGHVRTWDVKCSPQTHALERLVPCRWHYLESVRPLEGQA